MNKTMYLIRGSKTDSYIQFKSHLFTLCNKIAQSEQPISIKMVLTEEAPPSISIIPFKKKKVAVISIYDENSSSHPEIENTQGLVGRFNVTEALPVAYNKTWKDGLATPGICLLTLFNKKQNIDYNTFINRWHNSHTPLSLKIHPLWHYNRNVVNERSESNIENWDGIVEEHVKTRSELLNPCLFFGNALNMIPNMLRVYLDTKSFLDYVSIEPYLTKEYHIKTI